MVRHGRIGRYPIVGSGLGGLLMVALPIAALVVVQPHEEFMRDREIESAAAVGA